MPAHQYINLLFETLENAVTYGVIRDWALDGQNIAIHRGGRRTTISQLEAADYLIDLLEKEEVLTPQGSTARL